MFARASRFFVHFFAVTVHYYDVKMPNFTFYGGRKQATTKFYFSFLTFVPSPRNQLQGNWPTLDIFSDWNKRDKV